MKLNKGNHIHLRQLLIFIENVLISILSLNLKFSIDKFIIFYLNLKMTESYVFLKLLIIINHKRLKN